MPLVATLISNPAAAALSASLADEAARLLIDIIYEVKATNDRRSLVYPFYLIPEE